MWLANITQELLRRAPKDSRPDESGDGGNSTSLDEQLRVYNETNDLKAVVARQMVLTMDNVPRNVNLTAGKTAGRRTRCHTASLVPKVS